MHSEYCPRQLNGIGFRGTFSRIRGDLMKLKTALATGAAACALMAASSASAGTYVSVFGGWSNPDTEFNVAGASVSSSTTADFNRTFTATGIGNFYSWSTPTYTQNAKFLSYYGSVAGYLQVYYKTHQTIAYK